MGAPPTDGLGGPDVTRVGDARASHAGGPFTICHTNRTKGGTRATIYDQVQRRLRTLGKAHEVRLNISWVRPAETLHSEVVDRARPNTNELG